MCVGKKALFYCIVPIEEKADDNGLAGLDYDFG